MSWVLVPLIKDIISNFAEKRGTEKGKFLWTQFSLEQYEQLLGILIFNTRYSFIKIIQKDIITDDVKH